MLAHANMDGYTSGSPDSCRAFGLAARWRNPWIPDRRSADRSPIADHPIADHPIADHPIQI